MLIAFGLIAVVVSLISVYAVCRMFTMQRQGLDTYSSFMDGDLSYDDAMAAFRKSGFKVPDHW